MDPSQEKKMVSNQEFATKLNENQIGNGELR